MSQPVIVYKTSKGNNVSLGSYAENGSDQLGVMLPVELQKTWSRAGGEVFDIVPGGGQTNGPIYNFYISKFEVTNDDLLRFLNNAEANTNSAQGANMFFDVAGNVWINPAMQHDRDEMFTVARSRLVYDSRKPLGRRYGHVADAHGENIYVNHPATGISWFGAVKYCNWLTIFSGRGEQEVCYSEGTNSLDWAPLTATNWANGYFEDSCRASWLTLKGFRLPMGDSISPRLVEREYSEFYKAAAWNGMTNTYYGFGRNTLSPLDASFKREDGTLPVGFFSGTNMLGTNLIHDCQNFFGIRDLSGNVEEWLTDFARPGSAVGNRASGGVTVSRRWPMGNRC